MQKHLWYIISFFWNSYRAASSWFKGMAEGEWVDDGNDKAGGLGRKSLRPVLNISSIAYTP